MGEYSKKGTYAGYDKNNKEREALDYYATPTIEALNILETIKPNLNDKIVLDNSCGGGHILEAILIYIDKYNQKPSRIIGTDIKDRGYRNDRVELYYGEEYDFLSDAYPFAANITIMNPPYSVIEPFVLHSLDNTTDTILMLGRAQFLEGQSRYDKVFAQKKLKNIYHYVDRIACYKNGDFTIKPSSIQAYAWFMFDNNYRGYPTLEWIRRSDKK